jgi:hypothetical protein
VGQLSKAVPIIGTVLVLLSRVCNVRRYCNGERITYEILMDCILSAPLNTKESSFWNAICMPVCTRVRALISLVPEGWRDLIHILNLKIYPS